ncbi:ArgS-related anticodon-binding protein NrtL [Streptomyces lancefieldiae]|uniref:arginine--tRNA ligase n=1 Tax=Streptomyces lancefieldiae TaxID=3075520 RepID=A0ABU3AVS4_9ACTN|nr:DALR anticodon-binding domain-containing protein [Streptomyces sp. DSM 40712]MDT0613667.1 DALR anticodon-binding domain-containing protein [Streptomyces sp. DSM 40712]
MTPVELSRTVLHAVRRAVDAGELGVTVPARAVVTPPGPGGCGDYATTIALQLARPAGQPPRRVAEVLRPYLVEADGISDVVLTGPGFLNISLHGTAPAALLEEILRRGSRYGYAEESDGRIVQLHCPHDLRAVVVAEAAARILRSQGALVRTTAEAFDPEWTAALGVRVDAIGPPAPVEPRVTLRPVPAPGDPDPLRLGRDAARWALLHPAPHDRPRTGDEHLVQRESNPLFRVRYAHARTRALSRNAADLRFAAAPGPVTGVQELLAALADQPRVLAAAAAHRAPDRLARHLVTVADAALPFLPTVLPRGAEKPSAAHRARLALAEAVGAVLAGGLTLLGIDAPDHL